MPESQSNSLSRGTEGLIRVSSFPLTQPCFCSQVGPIEATSFTLKAVRPQAKYCVQVAAQDLTDYGEWSDKEMCCILAL